MVKAIIFDCFGVLTTEVWFRFKREHFGSDPALLQQATDLRRAVDGGFLSYGDFMAQIADMAGIPKAEATRFIEDNVANDELFDYIRDELKPRFKIGMLSNAGSDRILELFSKEQAALLDAVCLSCETGALKPDPRAYRIAAERLGVSPDACIFTDDQERYCTAAEETGMKSVVYRDFAQFKRDLAPLV
jgi:putative hydrolase of the HAD superfamily